MASRFAVEILAWASVLSPEAVPSGFRGHDRGKIAKGAVPELVDSTTCYAAKSIAAYELAHGQRLPAVVLTY
jgi:hypothetical protein